MGRYRTTFDAPPAPFAWGAVYVPTRDGLVAIGHNAEFAGKPEEQSLAELREQEEWDNE